jgi:hypothetical protein
MNTKTSGDISASAVVVLALGLLIAKTFVPEQSAPGYSADSPPIEIEIEDVTLVDAHQGRLFECSQGDLSLSGRSLVDTNVNRIGVVDIDTELQALAQHAVRERTPLVPDCMVLLALVAFGAVAASVLQVDHQEMLEEEWKDSSRPAATATQSQSSRSSKAQAAFQFGCAHGIMRAFVAIGAAAIVWLVQNSLMLGNVEDSDSELHALAQRASGQRMPLMPDCMVILALAAFAALGAAIMRIDQDEMAEAAHRPSEREVQIPDVQSEKKRSFLATRVFGILSVIVLIAVAASFCLEQLPLAPEYVSASEFELQALVQLAPLHSDSAMMLGIAAFAVLGAAVLRVDHEEMIEECNKPLKPQLAITESAASVPSAQDSKVEAVVQSGQAFSIVVLAIAVNTAIAIIMVAVATISVELISSSPTLGEVRESDSELHALADGYATQRVSTANDCIVLFALAAFAFLGVAALRVDHKEMVEELQRSPQPEVAIPRATAGIPSEKHEGSFVGSVFRIFAVTVLLLTIATVWMIQSTFLVPDEMQGSDHELQALLLRSSLQETALAPDYVASLVLVAIVAIGAAVMRVDHEEILADLQNAPETKVTDPKITAKEAVQKEDAHTQNWLFGVMLTVITVVVAVAGAYLMRECAVPGEAGGITSELQLLPQQLPYAAISDKTLILGLGAFAVVGAGIARTDHWEMVEDLRNA